ncbi:MAG: transporter substrate-binding domain-containing protein [Deltaproteobacteria bacterium]|nr:transporter substrate-binding domain-containing protein [Deltaproteobacteria bacterium]
MRKIFVFVLLFYGIGINLAYSKDAIKVSAAPSIWAWEVGNKRMAGPIIDLVNEIFSELEIPVKTESLPWTRAMQFLKDGKLDVMLTIFHTEERSKFIKYSIPYTAVHTSVFVPRGHSFRFTKFEDLIGKEGVMVKDDSLGKEFTKFLPKLKIDTVIRPKQLIRMLNMRRVDYAVHAKFALLIEAKKLSLFNKIEVLPIPIEQDFLHFGFSKKSTFLKYLPRVNKKIKQFINDGTISKTIEKAVTMAASK